MKSKKAQKGIPIELLFVVLILVVVVVIIITIFIKRGAKPADDITADIIGCKGIGDLVGKKGVCISENTPCKGIKRKWFMCSQKDPDLPYCCFEETGSSGAEVPSEEQLNINYQNCVDANWINDPDKCSVSILSIDAPDSIKKGESFSISCTTNVHDAPCIRMSVLDFSDQNAKLECPTVGKWDTSADGTPVFEKTDCKVSSTSESGEVIVYCTVNSVICSVKEPYRQSKTVMVTT